ncbi:MAG: insulinase family protein, partial [Alphaproteobacteria bacterium]
KLIVEQERKLRKLKDGATAEENHWRKQQGLQKIPLETKQSLKGISIKDVKTFIKTNYKPNNASLIIVSPANESTMLSAVKKHFNTAEKSKFNPTIDKVKSYNGIVNGLYEKDNESPYIDIIFEQKYDYKWEFSNALINAIDMALKQHQKKNKVAYKDAWVSSHNFGEKGFFIRIEIDKNINIKNAVKDVATAIKNLAHSGVSKDVYNRLIFNPYANTGVKNNDTLYTALQELDFKAYNDLPTPKLKKAKLTYNKFNKHLKEMINPKWLTFRTNNYNNKQGKELLSLYKHTLGTNWKKINLAYESDEVNLNLQDISKHKKAKIVKETNFAKNITFWQLENGANVFFVQGKGTTTIDGIKPNNTGHNEKTLKPLTEKLWEVPLQGFKAGEVQSYMNNEKMADVSFYPNDNYIMFSAFRHGATDKELFSVIRSYFTENINIGATKIEKKNKLSSLDEFNKKVRSIYANPSIYEDTSLTKKQANKIYKDYIQNVNGYTFIISSNTPKNKIKELVQKAFYNAHSDKKVKKNKPPYNKQKITANKTLTYTGTKKEATVLIYNIIYNMPYTFKNDMTAKIWGYSINRNASIALREKMQATYYVTTQTILTDNGQVRFSMQMEVDNDKLDKVISVLKTIPKKAIQTLDKDIDEFKKNTSVNFARGGYESDKITRNKIINFVKYKQPYTTTNDDVKGMMTFKAEKTKQTINSFGEPVANILLLYKP